MVHRGGASSAAVTSAQAAAACRSTAGLRRAGHGRRRTSLTYSRRGAVKRPGPRSAPRPYSRERSIWASKAGLIDGMRNPSLDKSSRIPASHRRFRASLAWLAVIALLSNALLPTTVSVGVGYDAVAAGLCGAISGHDLPAKPNPRCSCTIARFVPPYRLLCRHRNPRSHSPARLPERPHH